MSKIAALVTDLFEDVEYTEPAKAYQEAGHQVTAVAAKKGTTVTGKHTVSVDAGK